MIVSKVFLLKHFLDVLEMGDMDFNYVVLPEEKVPELNNASLVAAIIKCSCFLL